MDNSSSVPGSSYTIKGKPAAGGPAKKVPNTLYNCVKEALAARKVWEAKRDQHSELMLQFAEKMVNSSAYYYKYIDPVLPCNWEYNPATAGTLEPKDNIPALGLVEEPEKKMKTKRFEDGDSWSDSSPDSGPDVPSMILRNLIDVPLKEDDIESWLQFKKFDEDYPIDNIPALSLVEEPEKKMKTERFEDGDDDSDASSDSSFDCGPDVPSMILRKLIDVPLKEYDIESWLQFKKFDEGYERPTFIPGCKPDEIKFPVNIEHPFVSAIGYFAVNCFNEAFEEFVEKGEHNHLRDPAFTECTYFKPGDSFWFDMTILADEYGFRGIYQARVECTIDNGERTLHHYVLTDIKCGKKESESKSKSSKGIMLIHKTTWC